MICIVLNVLFSILWKIQIVVTLQNYFFSSLSNEKNDDDVKEDDADDSVLQQVLVMPVKFTTMQPPWDCGSRQ
jgi:hypothetical protein